jgi:hypothetical protein
MRSALARTGALDDGPLPDGFASLESSVSVFSAAFGWGDVGAILEHGARSAELEGPDSPWRPVVTWPLGWGDCCKGELDLAERWLRETAALAPRTDQWIAGVAAIANLSLVAGMRGRRPSARAGSRASGGAFRETRELLNGCADPGVLPARLAAAEGGRARSGGPPADGASLSDREPTVLRLLTGGLSEREIARELWLVALPCGYASVTSNVVESSAVESPPTQTSNDEASITQSRAAAFQ